MVNIRYGHSGQFSNGSASGFQMPFEIQTISKPNSFWPFKIQTSPDFQIPAVIKNCNRPRMISEMKPQDYPTFLSRLSSGLLSKISSIVVYDAAQSRDVAPLKTPTSTAEIDIKMFYCYRTVLVFDWLNVWLNVNWLNVSKGIKIQMFVQIWNVCFIQCDIIHNLKTGLKNVPFQSFSPCKWSNQYFLYSGICIKNYWIRETSE